MKHIYTIPGEPAPWKNPLQRGRTSYDGQQKMKNAWSISLEYQREGQPFYIKKPLELDIAFYYAVPTSLKPKHKDELYNKPYPFQGGVDHLIRFMFESCRGILFDNESTITDVTVIKRYSINPRTEFSLSIVGDEDNER